MTAADSPAPPTGRKGPVLIGHDHFAASAFAWRAVLAAFGSYQGGRRGARWVAHLSARREVVTRGTG